MVPMTSLWLPILVAAILVFFGSFVIHMFIGYHAGDYRRLPSEDAVMDAMRGFSIPPGDYMMPRPGRNAMKDPEFVAKHKKGPVVMMTVFPPGDLGMGRQLVFWFVYCLIVGVFTAHLASLALAPGASYRVVFHFTALVAFLGYGLALWQQSIWYGRDLMATLRSNLDALIYAMLTGGTFGWLWP
jgi:hypothetical protein